MGAGNSISYWNGVVNAVFSRSSSSSKLFVYPENPRNVVDQNVDVWQVEIVFGDWPDLGIGSPTLRQGASHSFFFFLFESPAWFDIISDTYMAFQNMGGVTYSFSYGMARYVSHDMMSLPRQPKSHHGRRRWKSFPCREFRQHHTRKGRWAQRL